MLKKKGRVQSKIYIGSTFEKNIKELDPRDAYLYLGIEDSHDRQHKNEKEKLKKEYMRRLRLVSGTDLSAKNKIQTIRSSAVPVLQYRFGILTGTKKKCKFGQENEETANHPWTASPKGRHRSLVCSQKAGRKGSDELEEAYTVEIMKLVEYVDRKEDTLIQIVRMHQHNINLVVLQTARCLRQLDASR
jgi:hypothetical protein